MTLGENITRLRGKMNMSQSDLADALDVSRQSVSKWETDNSLPEISKLIQLSELFGVTLDELVKGKTTMCTEVGTSARRPVTAERPMHDASKDIRRQVAGIIMVCVGAAATFLMLALGWAGFTPVFVVPLFLCGIICLTTRKRTGLKCAWTVYLSAAFLMHFLAGADWTALFGQVRQLLSSNAGAAQSIVRTASFAATEFAALLLLLAFTVYSYRNVICEPTRRCKIQLVIGWIAYLFLRIVLPYFLTDQYVFDQALACFSQYGQIGRLVILFQLYLYIKQCIFLVLFAWLLVRTIGIWRWKRASVSCRKIMTAVRQQ